MLRHEVVGVNVKIITKIVGVITATCSVKVYVIYQ